MALNPLDFYPEGYGPRETRQSVLNNYAQNPEQAAGDIKLAQQFKTTPFEVSERRDDFLKQAEADSVVSKTAEVPALAAFINANPQNAALIKDDVDNAAELGRMFKLEGDLNLPKGELSLESSRAWRPGFLDRMGERWRRGTQGVADAFAGSRAEILENLFGYSDEARQEAQTILNRIALHNKANDTINLAHSDNFFMRLLESNVEAAPQLASQIGGALIPGGGGLLSALSIASQISGGQYADLRNQGVSSGRAAVASLVNTALQGPLEYIGTMTGVNLLTASGMVNVAKTALLETVIEPLTEYVQEYPDAATTIWGTAGVKDMSLADQANEFWNSLGEIHENGLQSAMAVSLFGAFGGGAKAIHEYGRVRNAQNDAGLFASLDANAAESKLKTRLPEAYESLVAHLTRNGPVDTVYVSAEAFRQTAEGLGQTLYQEVLDNLGISQEEAAKAEALGADLAIPLPKYQARMAGSDLSQALREHLKFKPDAMTLGEAAAWEKDSETRYSKVLQELETSMAERTAERETFDQAAAPILQELEGLYGKEAAGAQMKLLRAGAIQSAARWSAATGEAMTPAQWLTEQAKLRVQVAEDGSVASGRQVLFQPTREDVTLADEALAQDSEAWGKTIDSYLSGGLKQTKPVTMLKQTPLVLQMLGAQNLPVSTSHGVLNKTIAGKHRLSPDLVKQIPGAMANPIMVLRTTSETAISDLTMMLELKDEYGATIVVPVALNKSGGKYTLNFVPSMHVKNDEISKEPRNGWFLKQIKDGNALYINEAKMKDWTHVARRQLRGGGSSLSSSEWASSVGRQLPTGGTPSSTLENNIYTEADLVNLRAAEILETYYQSQQEQIRGQVQFSDAETVITLFKDAANLSTFLHEIGHVFLKDLEAIAATGKAPETVMRDLTTLREFAGDLNSREGQEKLARAFEAYLREGRAPSLELRSAFRRFADWLTAIYKSLRTLNVEINDEVRGVFDRMLAAEADIEAAAAYHEADTAMVQTAQSMMTEDEQQRYAVAKEQARAQSLEARQARYLRAYWEAVGGKRTAYESAKAEINQKPVYAAQDMAIAAGGLNREQLAEFYGEKGVLALMKKRPGLVRNEGTVDIEQLALKHEFANGEALYAEMLNAQGKMREASDLTRQMIAETEQNMLARIPEDGVLPGDEEYHNLERLTALLLEEKAIARQAGKTSNAQNLSSAEFVRDLARQVLEARPLRTAFSVALHSSAEARAAAASAKALAEGRTEEALEFKRRQSINHALVLEAMAARDERAKMNRLLKRVVKSEKVPHAYKEQIKALAEKYGLAPYKPMRPEELTPLRDFLAEVTKDDIFEAPPFEEWLLNGQTPESMTLGHLREIWHAIEWLAGHGNPEMDRLVSVDGNGTVGEAAAYGAEIIRNSGNVAPVYEEGTLKRKASDATRDLLAGLNNLQYQMMRADGYIEIGKKSHIQGWHSTLFSRLMDAHNQRANIIRREVQPMKTQLDSIRHDYMARFKKQFGQRTPEINGVPVPEIMREAGRYSWTAEHIWCLARNMGNAGNLKTLNEGYGLSNDALLRLTSILTKDEWLAVQTEGQMLGARYDETDAVFRKIYGRPMPDRVVPQPLTVKTAEGEALDLEGWYFYLAVDPKLNPDIAENQQQDILKGEPAFGAFGPAVAKGHTNARTGTARPVALSFEVFESALWDQIHFITHAPVLKDFDRITRNKEWRQAYIEGFGQQAYDELRPTLKYFARPTWEKPDAFDGFLAKNRQLATLFILGHNVKSFCRQFGGYFQAAPDLGVSWIIKGIGRTMLSPLDSFRTIKDLSPFIADRDKGYDQAMREALRQYKATFKVKIGDRIYTANDVHEFTMSLISIGDRMCTFPLWQGAYMKATEKLGMNQQEAIAYADRIIQKTQASATPLDLVRWQRDRGIKHLFTMFMSEALKKNNRLRYWWSAYRLGKIGIGEYGQHVACETIAPAIVMTVLFSLLSGSDEPPDKEDILLAMFNESALGTVPLLGQLPNATQFGRSVGYSPVFTGLDTTIKAVRGAANIFSDPGDEKAWASFYKALVDLTAFYSGVGNARRIYETAAEGWERMEMGETSNPFALLFRAPK